MASLRDIRKRLHSIESIQQLTKAMEMVAASQLHRAQAKARHTALYVAKIKEVLDRLTFALNGISSPLLVEKKEKNKIGLVVVAADMGLSGSYNSDVFKHADKFLKKMSQEQVELILIGRKTVEHYSRRDWKIRHEISNTKDLITTPKIEALTDQLVQWFLKDEFDEIWVIYAHYVNIVSHQILTEKFLNIGKIKQKENSLQIDYILEPGPEEVYQGIVRRYCTAKVQAFLSEARSSELAARVFAMKTATKNANDMIEKLTLIRNKIRQAEITKEMLEITSGAEGLK